MSQHRRDVRPRYGRITALATSVLVSGVAALGGMGILGTSSASAGAAAEPASYHRPAAPTASSSTDAQQEAGSSGDVSTGPDAVGAGTPGADSSSGAAGPDSTHPGAGPQSGSQSDVPDPKALPADSGTGRRIVFDQSAQRVWLVDAAADHVQRTYPVSGSVTHNLQPGTYAVYSRSRWAVGVDDSGVMQYFVRFTQGPTGAAIGFHSIPTKNGVPLQSKAQLGTPQSHGCIRQDLPDAIALWNFAPEGTKVVVVA